MELCQASKVYQGNQCLWMRLLTYPKVAGAELRTSGGTYAAVPTNVQALSSVQHV
jgi:hypothetical protein